MIAKNKSFSRAKKAIFGLFFGVLSIFSLISPMISTDVYAESSVETTEETVKVDDSVAVEDSEVNKTEDTAKSTGITTSSDSRTNACKDKMGEMGWVVCPGTNKLTEAVDWLYGKIREVLVINPVEARDGQPIYELWKYFKGVTNIVFIVFLLVVIYSQITGLGISNYGIKKALPKLIETAILVNLSFILCSLAVDVSNIIGESLRGMLESIEIATLQNIDVVNTSAISLSEIYSVLSGVGTLGIGAAIISFESGTIWMLIPIVLGAVVAVATGLITIAMRQAVVALLIMIAPLAIVAYMLPNTEQWFRKWRQLFTRMLVFYPLFSLLFGASSLAGWAIIASANDGFFVILGMAVQIFPLFFSWNLMKMSGTILGTINGKLNGIFAKPLASNRAWAESRRELTRQKSLSAKNAYTPSLKLAQFLSNRKIAREAEIAEHAETVKNRGLAYGAKLNYKKGNLDGVLSRDGEDAYEMSIRNARYQQTLARHKANMQAGFGYKAPEGSAERARLTELDRQAINAFDDLAAEQARLETIEYENARGRHKRMHDAVNAHFDSENAGKSAYKAHFDNAEEYAEALSRYNTLSRIMDNDPRKVQYAEAAAAQAYDTQMKIITSKFQKYFEMTPPTQDNMYRLKEFSKISDIKDGAKALDEIDAIIAGLRVINQRGDTDLVKSIVDDLVDKQYGGMQLGTHASQALASFLMFEVKDNDPFLRRFGKYINLETANVYNANNRKEMDVTYDEYIKGYHDEPDGTRMYAKKDMKKLVEGTSLDNVERTAFSNLDESLKKAYGFDANHPNKAWDIDGWLRKREEIQTAFEPAFLSASLKWLSGSEQINSGVKFWTGYEAKQKKDEHGNIVVDEHGDPVYDLAATWKDRKAGFAGHEEEVEKYFRKKTMDYFKDQTTGQVLGMRTDYRDPAMEHLMEQFFVDEENANGLEKGEGESRRKYEAERAEIQTRYADKTAEEAEKARGKDLKKLKMEIAGKQFRKIMGETGKLKQMYRTRTSGTAINAKDWLRGWAGLDDEDALREEMNKYEEYRKAKKEEEGAKRASADPNEEMPGSGGVYTEADVERFLTEMMDLKDRIMDEEPTVFFEDTLAQLEEWFGEDSLMAKKYDKFYHEDDPSADTKELYGYLKEILSDLKNYPDA